VNEGSVSAGGEVQTRKKRHGEDERNVGKRGRQNGETKGQGGGAPGLKKLWVRGWINEKR